MGIEGYAVAWPLQNTLGMQAQIEIDASSSQRSLLCRMKALLTAGPPSNWVRQELHTLEDALMRIDATKPEPCRRCGASFHL
jgi:hypothetical protein